MLHRRSSAQPRCADAAARRAWHRPVHRPSTLARLKAEHAVDTLPLIIEQGAESHGQEEATQVVKVVGLGPRGISAVTRLAGAWCPKLNSPMH